MSEIAATSTPDATTDRANRGRVAAIILCIVLSVFMNTAFLAALFLIVMLFKSGSRGLALGLLAPAILTGWFGVGLHLTVCSLANSWMGCVLP